MSVRDVFCSYLAVHACRRALECYSGSTNTSSALSVCACMHTSEPLMHTVKCHIPVSRAAELLFAVAAEPDVALCGDAAALSASASMPGAVPASHIHT